MKISLNVIKKIYISGFLLIFLPMFVIYIVPNTVGFVEVGLIFWIGLYLLALIKCHRKIKNFVFSIIRIKFIKYYLLFFIFATLTTIVHVLKGEYIAPVGYYIIRFYKFFILPSVLFFFPLFSIVYDISLKLIIKILCKILYGVYCIAIIQFFVYYFKFKSLFYVFSFFTNARAAMYRDPFEVFEIVRVHSVFSEPSFLGTFTFVFMPIIFSFLYSENIICKNVFLNYVVKHTFIPLVIVVLFMTKSPIYIILCLIEYIFLVVTKRFDFLKKHFYISCISVFAALIVIVLLSNIIVNTQVYYRILVVISYLNDFSKLAMFEGSLYSRILSYFLQMQVLFKNIFCGVGVANVGVAVNSIFLQSPMPYTLEAIRNYYMYSDRTGINESVVYTNLAQVGIIGFSIYFYFVLLMYKSLGKVKKYLNIQEQNFADGLRGSIITSFIISFYNLGFSSFLLWIIFGLVLLIIQTVKLRAIFFER